MTVRTPGSPSLKLSRTSVMLYENGYERLPDGRGAFPGESVLTGRLHPASLPGADVHPAGTPVVARSPR